MRLCISSGGWDLPATFGGFLLSEVHLWERAPGVHVPCVDRQEEGARGEGVLPLEKCQRAVSSVTKLPTPPFPLSAGALVYVVAHSRVLLLKAQYEIGRSCSRV